MVNPASNRPARPAGTQPPRVRLRTAALLAAAALALAGCGSGSPAGGTNAAAASAAQSGAPVDGGTLVYAEVTPINNWQTQAARFYEKSNVLHSVLDRLTYFDPEKGELVPWIASAFSANADSTEFTFTIRPGVTFSDGSALDAAAVKANLDSFGLGIPAAQIQPNVDFAGYQGSEVIGTDQVKVTLDAPNSNFLRATSSVTAGLVSPPPWPWTRPASPPSRASPAPDRSSTSPRNRTRKSCWPGATGTPGLPRTRKTRARPTWTKW